MGEGEEGVPSSFPSPVAPIASKRFCLRCTRRWGVAAETEDEMGSPGKVGVKNTPYLHCHSTGPAWLGRGAKMPPPPRSNRNFQTMSLMGQVPLSWCLGLVVDAGLLLVGIHHCNLV